MALAVAVSRQSAPGNQEDVAMRYQIFKGLTDLKRPKELDVCFFDADEFTGTWIKSRSRDLSTFWLKKLADTLMMKRFDTIDDRRKVAAVVAEDVANAKLYFLRNADLFPFSDLN